MNERCWVEQLCKEVDKIPSRLLGGRGSGGGFQREGKCKGQENRREQWMELVGGVCWCSPEIAQVSASAWNLGGGAKGEREKEMNVWQHKNQGKGMARMRAFQTQTNKQKKKNCCCVESCMCAIPPPKKGQMDLPHRMARHVVWLGAWQGCVRCLEVRFVDWSGFSFGVPLLPTANNSQQFALQAKAEKMVGFGLGMVATLRVAWQECQT